MARCCSSNKQEVWYALYSSKTEITDGSGNYTGEYTVTHSTPVQAFMNVSPAHGTSSVEEFGIDVPYTKTIVTEDLNTQFTEATLFWIGITPSASTPANYRVTAIAKGLPRSGTCKIAVREI